MIIFFTTIYCFDFVFNSISNICIFFSSALFSLTESSKIKYLFPFFYIYPLPWLTSKFKGFTLNIFTIINFCNCDVSNIVNINSFVMLFVYFQQDWVEIFEIDHVLLKINNEFGFWSLFVWLLPFISLLNHCLSTGTKLNMSNIFFKCQWK